ncbi:hypothetical protein TRIUR3_04848 [Triticum urartu]|uniref:Uncharacterized protein n=1 Tax=Triticum urartu TaxID=4572 RepID=M7Z6J6_TRIUA|nr:hypothetical protein TRIUR3_04848 [Triticum urartu]
MGTRWSGRAWRARCSTTPSTSTASSGSTRTASSKFDYVYDDGNGPLQEMAERFGWDLSDEDGWGRLDFRLLSTSYGGRIPRKADRRQSTDSGSNRSPHGGGALFDTGAADPDGPRGKRDERRERMRTRREE